MFDQSSVKPATTVAARFREGHRTQGPALDLEGTKALAKLLENPVLEIFPMPGIERRIAALPENARVAVTCSPTGGMEQTLRLTELMAKQGFRVVPHISARTVIDHAHLERTITRLASLDLKEAFVIGGDGKKPAGPFASALELLSAIFDLGHGFDRIGIAGYPEGHPAIHDEALLRALADKQAMAQYMVTQMCFDPETIITWIRRMRRCDIRLPVHVGLPGALKIQKLLRFSLRVGVGDSIRFLKKHAGILGHLVSSGTYAPDALVADLPPQAADPAMGIEALHFYTFNELQSTEEWRLRKLGSVLSEGES
jgi:methylenetetrahydrofolate reductase (NADPH)